MYRHHEHQSLGQEQSASPTTSTERCIPIKRRLLNKFYSSKRTASAQANGRIPVSDAELSCHGVDQVEQSEAPLDLRKRKKATSSSLPRFKWESADRQEQASQQLQSPDTILEQCLRGVDPVTGRPTVQNVLQYHDLSKLSIGERTELDKMRDDEILEKYLKTACDQRDQALYHSESSARRPSNSKATISTMLFDQEPHWDGPDNLGSRLSRKSSRADTFGRSNGSTPTRQHQPYESQSESYDAIPQDLAKMGSDLSTISVDDLWAPVIASQELISVHHISSLATDECDNLPQIGNSGITTDYEIPSRNVTLKQPKGEQHFVAHSCQRTTSHCNVSSGGTASSGEAEHLHVGVVERLHNHIENIVVKSEADTCSFAENGQRSTPATNAERDPESKATVGVKNGAGGKCPICSDVVSGYHYGTHSCESCKGFFKRTIQNKRNERLACALAGNCVISLQNRKHCAYCRFKKCLDVGMKQEAVRGDRQRGGRSMYEGSSEQRRRLQLQTQQQQNDALGQTKKRKPRKRAPSTATQPPTGDRDDQSLEIMRMLPQQTLGHQERMPSNPMTSSASIPTTSTDISKPQPSTSTGSTTGSDSCDEYILYLRKLESIEATFFNPFGLPRISIDRCHSEKSLLTGSYYLMDHFCKKMPSWIEMLPYLQDLEVGDRSVLLKANWLQVLVLTVCFRCHDNEGHLILPDRSHCDMMAVVNAVAILDIVRRMKQLAQKLQALKTTQDEYFYLKLLILLNPDVKNLSQPSRIRSYQEKVQEHLFDLGLAREGISASMKIGRLLLKLSELERLSHLIKEHLVFTQVAGQLGHRKYSNLEDMLEDY